MAMSFHLKFLLLEPLHQCIPTGKNKVPNLPCVKHFTSNA